MYNETHLYDLSFVAPGRRPRTNPQLVFSFNTRGLEEITERLQILADRQEPHVESYCGEHYTFAPPTPDMFGRVEFGYGNCGFVQTDGEYTRLHIELSDVRIRCRTLTIHALASALLVPLERSAVRTNRQQQLDLETVCSNSAGYGHAIGGYVSAGLCSWLQQQRNGDPDMFGRTRIPDEVVRAMKATWAAVAGKRFGRWTRECTGYVSEDGRFILQCFGNACDVAIYPDQVHGRLGEHAVQFGCHNLDTAAQQLTLIAGLARLCELARKDEL